MTNITKSYSDATLDVLDSRSPKGERVFGGETQLAYEQLASLRNPTSGTNPTQIILRVPGLVRPELTWSYWRRPQTLAIITGEMLRELKIRFDVIADASGSSNNSPAYEDLQLPSFDELEDDVERCCTYWSSAYDTLVGIRDGTLNDNRRSSIVCAADTASKQQRSFMEFTPVFNAKVVSEMMDSLNIRLRVFADGRELKEQY